MRIVLHAGLHKSGTTSLQNEWRQAYGGGDDVRYPTDPRVREPGHHRLVWPLIDAFKKGRANDLVWAATLYPRRHNLRQVIRQADSDGTRVLLISSEELDRIERSDVSRFAKMLDGHDVTVVLTITRPMHRWCSSYGELVKHGLSRYPRDAVDEIIALTSLVPGRVEELLRLIPAQRRIVRVVRTSPHEETLARDVAALVGLDWPGGVDPSRPRNVSMGADIEIVRRLNAADIAIGTVEGKTTRRKIARWKRAGIEYADVEGLSAAYEVPDVFWTAAKQEHELLTTDVRSSGIEVVDPHGQLSTWLDPEPPAWYAEISRREAVLPRLPAPPDPDTLLWRVRQERSALRVRLNYARARIAELEGTVAAAQGGRSASSRARRMVRRVGRSLRRS